MIVGSIKENLSLEKRVSITPETAKNIINLGLKVIIENNYANDQGGAVYIRSSSNVNLSNVILQNKKMIFLIIKVLI